MAQVGATFPGVDQVIACTYTRTLGTAPNIAAMRFIPQPSLPVANGTLAIFHGDDFVQFPNCRVDRASIQLTSQGHVESIQILDRRWKWAFPSVDGIYNLRQPDGTIRSSSVRSAQQLAAILFDALGEQNYDVSALPGNDYPAVEWDCEPARLALERLCEQYGCDVDLDYLSNTTRIVVLGVGQNLPDNADIINVSFGADFSEVPDAIELCGDFVLVQSKLKLEAVGIETDGSIVPIDELSYRPDGGWDTEGEPGDLLADAAEDIQRLANMSVYRMFRAVSQADGSQNVPNYSGTVNDISQLLPLNDSIIEAYTVEAGNDPQAAYVSGVFRYEVAQNTFENTDINSRVSNDFRFLKDQGIVIFAGPVVKNSDDTPPVQTKPDLYLVTSYSVAHATRGQYVRYTSARQIANNGTPWMSVPRPSLKQTIRATYAADGVTVATVEDNKSEVDQLAAVILDAMQHQFQATGASQVVYRSIQPLQMDGARRQVTWSVDRHRRKPAPAMTVAAFNSEAALGALRTRERRRLLAAEHTLREAEQVSERRRKLRRRLGVVQ